MKLWFMTTKRQRGGDGDGSNTTNGCDNISPNKQERSSYSPVATTEDSVTGPTATKRRSWRRSFIMSNKKDLLLTPSSWAHQQDASLSSTQDDSASSLSENAPWRAGTLSTLLLLLSIVVVVSLPHTSSSYLFLCRKFPRCWTTI